MRLIIRKVFILCIILIILSIIGFAIKDENREPLEMEPIENDQDLNSVQVEDYGAVGDGKVDDTNAFRKAVASVENGGKVILDSKKTYRIKETVNINKDITLKSNTQENATIFMDSDDRLKPALMFSGEVKSSINLKTSQISTRDNSLNLPQIKGVEPGDLLLIESDSPWYFEPRTGTEDLHKGELHRIRSVNQSQILIEEKFWDTYDTSKEKINAKIIDPIQVSITNINIARSQSNQRTLGIKLQYTSESNINNVFIENATAIGIHIVSSYRTNVENTFIKYSNDKYSGYGIQSYGSSFSSIRDNKIIGSRRGIDVSGKYPDYFSTVEFNTVFGGGKNEYGYDYLTEDTQYGIGTHSTANYTVFRGNILGNLNYGVNIRSANVTIEQNQFLNYFKGACIILGDGRNIKIKQNITTKTELISDDYSIKLPNSIKEIQANTFIMIKRSYHLGTGSIKIEHNQIYDLSNEFIKFIDVNGSQISQVNDLQILNNIITYKNSTSRKPFLFMNSEFPITINQARISNNHIADSLGKPQQIIYNNVLLN